MARKSLIAFFAALLVLGLVACGGGGGNEDPQKVLDETFSGGKDYSSGVLEASLTTTGGAQNLDATATGPFEGNPGGLPKFDLKLEIKSPAFSGGVISTGDGAFLELQGVNYQVDTANLNNFKQLFLNLQQQATNPGIKVGDYVTDLSNDGNEDVGGVDTIHVSGKLDVKKLAETAQAAQQASGSDVQGLSQFLGSASRTEEASFDVYSGVDDKRVHRLDLHFKFSPSTDNQGGDVDASITLNDLGQPQTISQPTDVKPLGDLLQQLQSQALGQTGSGGSSGAATTTPTPPPDSQKSAYLECLSKASGDAAVQACNAQLQ